jgi:cytochrome P450
VEPTPPGRLPAFLTHPALPVVRDDHGAEPSWLVSDFAEAERLIADPAAYPTHRHESRLGLDELRRGPVNGAGIIAAEPRRHADLRALVTRPFTAAAVRARRPRVESIVHELVDAVVATGSPRFDLVSAVARPLPTRVMADVLGLDLPFDEIMTTVWTWMDDEYHVVPNVARLTDQRSHWRWWEEFLERRRQHLAAGEPPPAGLLADLLAAQAAGHEIDGMPLTDTDIIGTAEILLAAGASTTAASLSATVLLAHDAGVLAQLATPEQARAAAAEGLRMDSPFPFLARRTQNADVIAGCPVPVRALVLANVIAAQRDAARWPAPDEFRLDRPGGRLGMLAFGKGPHRCLGEPLAYLELEVALAALAARLPGLRVTEVAERQFGMVTHLPSVICEYDA